MEGLVRWTTDVRPPIRQPENLSSTQLPRRVIHESSRALASDGATPGLVERDGMEKAKGDVRHMLVNVRVAGVPGPISKSGN